MVQIHILSGRSAGEVQVVRHFPFCIGRSGKNHWVLKDPGIWDRHLTLDFVKNDGIRLKVEPGALATVNDQPQTGTRLRPGDVIAVGSVKLQFWLAAPRQRGLALRELAVWALLAGITLLQLWLILAGLPR